MSQKRNKRHGKNRPHHELNAPSALQMLAIDTTAFAQEMIYQHAGVGVREQSVRIEMIFPPEKRSGVGGIVVSPVFVEIESGNKTGVRTEISYETLLRQIEKRGYSSRANADESDD